MTQVELADRLGVTDKTVSKREQGRGVPDVSLLSKLSIILDTDIESILEGNLTHLKLNCKGVISMEYSDVINAGTEYFGIRSVYLQMSYVMLAGIKEVMLRGDKENIEIAPKEFGNGECYGMKIVYQETNQLSIVDTLQCIFFIKNHQSGYGVMVVNGMDFFI